jgi:hypothetical protein
MVNEVIDLKMKNAQDNQESRLGISLLEVLME